jgi:hypothetical protein
MEIINLGRVKALLSIIVFLIACQGLCAAQTVNYLDYKYGLQISNIDERHLLVSKDGLLQVMRFAENEKKLALVKTLSHPLAQYGYHAGLVCGERILLLDVGKNSLDVFSKKSWKFTKSIKLKLDSGERIYPQPIFNSISSL